MKFWRLLRRSWAASARDIGELACQAYKQEAQRTLVERIIRVWFQEEILEAHHDRSEVEYWLPVLSEDVQADVALEIDIGMIDLIRRMFPKGEERSVSLELPATKRAHDTLLTFGTHLTFGGS